MTQILISTLGIPAVELEDRLLAMKEVVEAHGYDFGVQIHHGSTTAVIDIVRDLEVPVIIHGPLAGQAINIATEDTDGTWEALERTGTIANEQFGVNEIIFNGFFLTDDPIPHSSRKTYWKSLPKVVNPQTHKETEFGGDLAYFETRDFHLRKQRVKVTYRRLQQEHSNLQLYFRNDPPVGGVGGRCPEDLVFSEAYLWLDIGALWASALAHDFDFYRGLDFILDGGRVAGVSLHANPMLLNQKNNYHPGHLSLTTRTDMGYQKIFYMLRQNRITRFCIEVDGATLDDVHYVLDRAREQRTPSGRYVIPPDILASDLKNL